MTDHETADAATLALAEDELALLVQSLGPDHPDTRAAAERVAGLLATLSPEARKGEGSEGGDARPMVGPYVTHALCAAAGIPVGYERLRRLAVRVFYRSALPAELAEMLISADLGSDHPGAIAISVRKVPAPRDTPTEGLAQWAEMVESVAEQIDETLATIARDVQAFPLTDGRVVLPDEQLATLPPADEPDARAVVDELMAELVAAKRSGNNTALLADLNLWSHAARVAFALAPSVLSESVAFGIARGLLTLLPEEREALLVRWSDTFSGSVIERLRA